LRSKDRGKSHNINAVPAEYGAVTVRTGVDGAELLEAYERGDIVIDGDGIVAAGLNCIVFTILVAEVTWKGDGGKAEDSDDEWEEDDEQAEDSEEDSEEGDGSDWEDVSNDGSESEMVDGSEEADSEGEWMDMDADHDEEETNADVDSEIVDGIDEAQTAGPVILTGVSKTRIEAQRLLTAEDFALIAKLKAAQAARIRDPRSRKRAHEESVNDGDNLFGDDDNEAKVELPEFAIDPEALGPGMRTKKATKIEKITKILEGRKDSKFDLGGHGGGLTNKEKERKKNFVMVRKGKRSVASKINKSNSDKRYEKMVHVR
jgi:hypothetical protein